MVRLTSKIIKNGDKTVKLYMSRSIEMLNLQIKIRHIDDKDNFCLEERKIT